MKLPPIPRISDHGSEVGLLCVIAVGVMGLLAFDLRDGKLGLDGAACLLVLQRVIEAVTERWKQRSFDRLGEQVGASVPAPDPPTKTTVES